MEGRRGLGSEREDEKKGVRKKEKGEEGEDGERRREGGRRGRKDGRMEGGGV